MVILTGELKVSEVTPSGNSNRRDHCHYCLEELELPLTSDLCSMYQSAELLNTAMYLSGAYFKDLNNTRGRLYQQ